MTHPSDIAGLSERLRFDAVRCEVAYSKGVASNIEEAAAALGSLSARVKELEAENERLRTAIKVDREVDAQSRDDDRRRLNELRRRAEQQRDEAVTALDRLASFSISGVHARTGKLSDVCKAWVDHKKDALAAIRRLASGPEGGEKHQESKP